MKFKILALLLLTTFIGKAQNVTIPDANFKTKLLAASSANSIAKNLSGNYFKIDANNDLEIQLSEAAQVSYLDISSSAINDLTGIAGFTALANLNVSNNALTALDLSSSSTLQQLNCSHNAIATLIFYTPVMTVLDASYNALTAFSMSSSTTMTAVNVSNNALTSIEVYANTSLTSLVFDNNNPLDTLSVGNNNFTSLTVANFPNLSDIQCGYNSFNGGLKLTSIITANLPALFSLQCNSNNISNLDLSGAPNLGSLICSHNNLASLNIASLTNLSQVDCSYNHINNLSTGALSNLFTFTASYNSISSPLIFSNFIHLYTLDISHNAIPSVAVNGCSVLQSLDCSYNALTALNPSGLSNLQTLNCAVNSLTSVNTTGLSALQTYRCNNNLFASLDVSALSSLVYFYCNLNQLQTVNLGSLTHLSDLDCSNNQLTTINVTPLPALNFLKCNNNRLTTINVAGLNNLNDLQCNYNLLTSVSISNMPNLGGAYFNNNQLTSLTINNLPVLNVLSCSYNFLTSMSLSNTPSSYFNLICNNNLFTTLDLTNNTGLYSLNCNNNQLETLFIKISNGSFEYNVSEISFSGNPNLRYICADELLLPTLQSKITAYGYTNCTANSYCSFSPSGNAYLITGVNRYDGNFNGCDASDLMYSNMKFTLSTNSVITNVIGDTSGNYTFPVGAGTTVITPKFENTYFTATPTSASIVFPTQTSPYTQNFCISKNGNHNDLEITLVPVDRARPGFDVNYKLIYKNKGTGTQSGSVNLNFNDAVLDLAVAIPAVTSQTTNNLSWSFTNLAPLESREIGLILNLNSPVETPPVQGGDVLNYIATITGLSDETPIDNTANLRQTVVNSFDPNDKTCLEGTIVSPTMAGQYVHYLIRFENTGTANAQNIVVKDIIDTSKYDITTLVPFSSSHRCYTRILNTNRVEFIFKDINLPFDDAHNDGYIVFKIKLKSSLVIGNTFSNTADIFFDYNSPITTNTYTSTLQTLSVNNPNISAGITVYPNPIKDTLIFKTEQSILKIEVFDLLGRIISKMGVISNTANLEELKAGTYLVKVYTNDGNGTVKIFKQ